MNKSSHSSFSAFGQGQSVHLVDYLKIILPRWKIAFGLFAAVFLLVAAYTFMQQPIYEASAILEIRKSEKGGVLEEIGLNNGENIAAAIEVLKSRTILEKVVERLNLDWSHAESSKGFTCKVRSLSVDGSWSDLHLVLQGDEAFQILDEGGNFLGHGRSGVPVEVSGLRIWVDIESGESGDSCRFTRVAKGAAIDGLMKSIRVQEEGKGTNILRLSALSTDPERARDIVNVLAGIFHEQSIVKKSREAGKTVDFVNQQLGGLRTVLDQSEKEIQQFKLNSGLLKLGPEGAGLVEKLVDLERQKTSLQMRKDRLVYTIHALKEAMDENKPFSPPNIEGVPIASEAATKLVNLEAERKALLVDFTESHPSVIELVQEIRRVEETLLATYQTALEALLTEDQNLNRIKARYDREMEEIPAAEQELAKMTRDNKVNAEIYTFLLQKQQEARIAQASTISNVEIIDPAVTPQKPIKPNKRKNLLLALVVGAMLGIGVAFFLDYMDDTLKTSDEVITVFGKPVLGAIPHFPMTPAGKRLLTYLEPKSPVPEAFRSLRTGIHFSNLEKDKKVILIASAFPDEGKTTVAANLALTLAQTGDKVLLLGADLRRPGIRELFGFVGKEGVTELLTGGNRGVLHTYAEGKIDVIAGGAIPPNPAELLASKSMEKLMDLLRQRYDYIVLDGPPVLPVTDAQILAALSDMVLVVVQPAKVPVKAAERLIETLNVAGAPIIGVALNDKTGKATKYYSSYEYYGRKKSKGYGYYN